LTKARSATEGGAGVHNPSSGLAACAQLPQGIQLSAAGRPVRTESSGDWFRETPVQRLLNQRHQYVDAKEMPFSVVILLVKLGI
jgi:hypothetical protein